MRLFDPYHRIKISHLTLVSPYCASVLSVRFYKRSSRNVFCIHVEAAIVIVVSIEKFFWRLTVEVYLR